MIHITAAMTAWGRNCYEIKCYLFVSHIQVQVRKKPIKSSFGVSAPMRCKERNKALNGHLLLREFSFLYINDDLLKHN